MSIEDGQPDGSNFKVGSEAQEPKDSWGIADSEFDADGFVRGPATLDEAMNNDQRMLETAPDSERLNFLAKRVADPLDRGAMIADIASLTEERNTEPLAAVDADIASLQEQLRGIPESRGVPGAIRVGLEEAGGQRKALTEEVKDLRKKAESSTNGGINKIDNLETEWIEEKHRRDKVRAQIKAEYEGLLELNPEAVGRLSVAKFVELIRERNELGGEIDDLESEVEYAGTVINWLQSLADDGKLEGAESEMTNLVGGQLSKLDSGEAVDAISKKMAELKLAQIEGLKGIQGQIKHMLETKLDAKKRSLQELFDHVRSGDLGTTNDTHVEVPAVA